MASAQQTGGRKEKSKVGHPRWTSDEQTSWLEENKSGFKDAQAKGQLTDFWPHVFETWFQKWPLGPPNARELEKNLVNDEVRIDDVKDRIKQWFNNHACSSASSSSGRRKLLDLSGKKPKMLPDFQAYLKLYKDEKLRSIIQDKWIDAWPTDKNYLPDVERPLPPVHFQNRIAKMCLQDETDEVKARVEEYRKRSSGDGRNLEPEVTDSVDQDQQVADVGNAREAARVKKAITYQRAIDRLDPTAIALLEQIFNETGMVVSLLIAGPEPQQGGNIVIKHYHHGRTRVGNDFSEAYAGWKNHVERPFGEFAATVFGAQVRIERSLPGTEHLHVHHAKTVSLRDSGSVIHGKGDGEDNTHARGEMVNPPTAKRNKTTKWRTNTPNPRDSAATRPNPPPNSYERERQANIARNKVAMDKIRIEWEAAHGMPATTKPRPKPRARGPSGSRPSRSTSSSTIEDLTTDDSSTGSISSDPPEAHHTASDVSDDSSCGSTTSQSPEHSMADDARSEVSRPSTTAPSVPLSDEEFDIQQIHDDDDGYDLGPSTPPRQSTVADVINPSDLPQWLRVARAELTKVNPHSQRWIDLIAVVSTFDRMLGHPHARTSTHTISPKLRPHELSHWLKCGRKYEAQPTVADVKSYQSRFLAWWVSLQPKSRGSTWPLSFDVPAGETWSELKKGSQNGFFGILLGLSFWCQATKTSQELEDFTAALDDIFWVATQMVKGCHGVKRSREEDSEDPCGQ